jgi:RNA-binding protein
MIHYILFRAQAHATEDVSRVVKALGNILPPETPVEAEQTEGYFGNSITILSACIDKKKQTEAYIHLLREKLPPEDLAELRKELPARVDEECDFYLRLSKQDAYLGDFRISYADDSIAIRSRIAAFPAKYESALAQLREYFGADEPSE